jgi:hypothetical protein
MDKTHLNDRRSWTVTQSLYCLRPGFLGGLDSEPISNGPTKTGGANQMGRRLGSTGELVDIVRRFGFWLL